MRFITKNGIIKALLIHENHSIKAIVLIKKDIFLTIHFLKKTDNKNGENKLIFFI
jgi:hypothetical protein